MSKEQHLFEIEMFCNIDVTFGQFNASLLSKKKKEKKIDLNILIVS